MTRGIRLNNPGNIRHGDDWIGMSDEIVDPDFVFFEHAVFGIRALVKVLRTYTEKHHLYTVEEIISRYAPAADGNDVASYIKHVCAVTGWTAHQAVNLSVITNMTKLVVAIIKHENGVQPYKGWAIKAGIVLAYEI